PAMKAYLAQHWGDAAWANVRPPFTATSAEDLALASQRFAEADFALAA
nr:dihydrodipicolinate synthase family protein [Desulfuromonadales bacterium]